jgi:hypothetical protein
MGEVVNNAVFCIKAVGQKQFGIICNRRKHTRYDFTEFVALLHKDVEVEGFIALCLRFFGGGFVDKVKPLPRTDALRLQAVIVAAGQHTNAGGQVAVDFHKTNCRKTVKPSISDFLSHSLKPIRSHTIGEGSAGLFLAVV